MSTTEIFPISWGGLDKGGLDKGFYDITLLRLIAIVMTCLWLQFGKQHFLMKAQLILSTTEFFLQHRILFFLFKILWVLFTLRKIELLIWKTVFWSRLETMHFYLKPLYPLMEATMIFDFNICIHPKMCYNIRNYELILTSNASQ